MLAWTRGTLALAGLAAAGFVVATVLLFPTELALVLQKADVLRATNIEADNAAAADFKSREGAIGELNALASSVLESRSGAMWPLWRAVLARVPSRVRLASVSYDRNAHTMALAGRAASRDDFLAFLEALRSAPEIASVDSPVSNVIREHDAPFTMTLSIR